LEKNTKVNDLPVVQFENKLTNLRLLATTAEIDLLVEGGNLFDPKQ
jgi:hypothetical protein